MAGSDITVLKIPRSDTFRGSPILSDGIGSGDLGAILGASSNTMTIQDPNVNVGMAIFATIESTPSETYIITKAIAGAGTVILTIFNLDANAGSAGTVKINYITR